jgi:hypothetical protein
MYTAPSHLVYMYAAPDHFMCIITDRFSQGSAKSRSGVMSGRQTSSPYQPMTACLRHQLPAKHRPLATLARTNGPLFPRERAESLGGDERAAHLEAAVRIARLAAVGVLRGHDPHVPAKVRVV